MVRLTSELVVRCVHGRWKKSNDESVHRFMRRLTHLHLEERALSELDGDVLAPCSSLSILYMFDNSLVSMPDLRSNTNLTQLYLQNNSIARMEQLTTLTKLTKLYLGGNAIALVEGLTSLQSLQELHLENQKLPPGEKLTFDPRSLEAVSSTLSVLNVSGDALDTLVPLAPLSHLSHLCAAHNALADLDETVRVLRGLRALRTLDLSANPACAVTKYRDRIILVTPLVAMLDGKEVTDMSRRFLQNWQASRITANQKQAMREMSSNERRRLGEEAESEEFDGQRPGGQGEGSSILMGNYGQYGGSAALSGQYKSGGGPVSALYSLPALPGSRYKFKMLPRQSRGGVRELGGGGPHGAPSGHQLRYTVSADHRPDLDELVMGLDRTLSLNEFRTHPAFTGDE